MYITELLLQQLMIQTMIVIIKKKTASQDFCMITLNVGSVF